MWKREISVQMESQSGESETRQAAFCATRRLERWTRRFKWTAICTLSELTEPETVESLKLVVLGKAVAQMDPLTLTQVHLLPF